MAVNSASDDPEKVCNELIQFEREQGQSLVCTHIHHPYPSPVPMCRYPGDLPFSCREMCGSIGKSERETRKGLKRGSVHVGGRG